MAKKPAAAELKKQGDELKAKFSEIRKTTHQFAMQIGKEGIVFMADRKKPADALWRTAKKEGGSSKGAKGTCTMNGKVLELDCDDPGSVPSGLPRMAKVYFADRAQSVKVVLKGEEDGEDAEAGGTEEAGAEAPAAGAGPAAGAEGGGGGAAAAAPDAADGAAAEGNAETAVEAPNGETDLEVLQREYSEIEIDLESAVGSENAALSKKVGGLKKMFEGQLNANPKKARAIFGLLTTTLDEARQAGDISEAPAGGGGDGPDPAAAEARRSQIAELESSVDALLAEFA